MNTADLTTAVEDLVLTAEAYGWTVTRNSDLVSITREAWDGSRLGLCVRLSPTGGFSHAWNVRVPQANTIRSIRSARRALEINR